MDTKQNSSATILDLAKANQEVYLTAYRVGYEAGWTAAMNKAKEIISQPITHKEPL